jgi:hypothetical protein
MVAAEFSARNCRATLKKILIFKFFLRIRIFSLIFYELLRKNAKKDENLRKNAKTL